MPNIASLRNYSKTRKTPRRSFEKERIDEELKLCGEFGLRAKKEVWRTKLVVAKLRKAARVLLTLDEKDPRRMFEGSAIIRQCRRIGVLDENQMKLDFVLSLTISNFLERRLQTQVYKLGLAKSIHHARVMIRQRHIRVGSQVVNIPQFCVRTESQKHIDFAPHSSLIVGAPPGRNLRKRRAADAAKKSGGAAAAGDDA